MALNCRVNINSNGEVTSINAPNGAVSKLYTNLKKIFGEKAKQVYAITETEGFKNFANNLRFAASRPQTQPPEDSQKQTAKLVTEYLKSKGQNINILSEEDMLEEAKKRGYNNLDAMVSSQANFTFSDLPKSIKEFLEEEYGNLITDFDWNSTMDSFTDSNGEFDKEGYNEWLNKHKEDNFNKNRFELIKQLNEDINLNQEKKKADKRLEAFESLIIPTLGAEVKNPALNKIQQSILMDYTLSAEQIADKMKEAEGVLDTTGSVTEQSDIFDGEGINLPNFERFVEKNPDYQNVFNDWKKLFDESINLSIKGTDSFRSSASKKSMKEALEYLSIETYNKNIQFLNQGDQIYGFYDTNTGEIYLTEELLSSENLVHEMWHSFSPVLKQKAEQGDQTAKEVLNQMESISFKDILGGEQAIKDRFERDINILITPATVRSFNEETSKLKTLTENYNNIAQEIAEGNLQNQDKFVSLQQEILETYQNEIENKVKDIEGVDVVFKNPYIGSWQGSYEPSLNMSLKVNKKANTSELSTLLYDLAESTSQDAFILEEASDIPSDELPLTFFDNKGFMHYPQLRVNFDKNLSVGSKSKIAQDLIKKGINEFSIDGDYLIISVINFSENIKEKQQEYDNKLETIKGTFTVGKEYGTEKVRNVQSYIRKSKYVGARNEGDGQSQTRQYDRSDIFKEEVDNSSLLSSEVYNPREGETYEQYRDRMIDEASGILMQKNSVQYFERIAKENGLNEAETKSFIQRVKDFIRSFSEWLTQQLGLENTSPEEIANLTQKELFDRITTSMLSQSQLKYNSKGQHLAPNGKPSNLTESQAKQVRTKAFKNWFGDWENDPQNASKVVDENGEPMVVYHVTKKKFNIFNKTPHGIHFGTKKTAEELKEFLYEEGAEYNEIYTNTFFINSKVMPKSRDYLEAEKLNIDYYDFNNIWNTKSKKNPDSELKSMAVNMFFEKILTKEESQEVIKENSLEKVLNKKNIDGYYYENQLEGRGENSYVVFNPNQIKSATDNIGTFDPNNNDIRFQVIGEKGAQRVEQYKQTLENAKKLEQQGTPLNQIERQTGWYKFKDDWRRLSPEAIASFKLKTNTKNKKLTLKEVLGDDNILFKFYPSMGKTTIIFTDNALQGFENKVPEDFKDSNAYYDERSNTVVVNTTNSKTKKQQEYDVAHEVAHVIQEIEGLPKGGNTQSIIEEAFKILNINSQLPLPLLYNKILTADKTKFSKNEQKILEKSLSSLEAFIKKDYKTLNQDYLHLMGEIDANVVAGALKVRDNQGYVSPSYSEMLNFYAKNFDIDLNNVYLLRNGSIRFQTNNNKTTDEYLLPQVQEMTFGDTVIKYSKAGNKLNLEEINTPTEKRGKGSAKKALKQFLAITDKKNLIVKLTVKPTEKGVDESKLKEFYQSEGFEFDNMFGFPSDFEMIRYPQNKRPQEQKEKEIPEVQPEYFDENGEVKLEVLAEYATNKSVELSNEEKQIVQNMAMIFGVTDTESLQKKLRQNFENRGFIVFEKNRMEDLSEAEKDFAVENKEQIERIILGSSSVEVQDYNSAFVFRGSQPFSVDNPYLVEEEIKSLVAGSENPRQVLPDEYKYIYDSNQEFKQAVDDLANNYVKAKVFEATEESLTEKPETDTEELLTETVNFSNTSKLNNQLTRLFSYSEATLRANEGELYDIAKDIEKQAVNAGIDLEGLAENTITKSIEDTLGYLTSLKDFIDNGGSTMKSFVSAHNNYFDISSAPKQEAVLSKDANDVLVETDLSETTLYEKYGLIHSKGNQFKNVNKESLEALYAKFMTNDIKLDKDFEDIDDLREYVQEQAGENETAEAIFLFKKYFGIQDLQKTESVENNLRSFDGDFNQLSTDFISEFYINKLKNKGDKFYSHFTVTKNGIVLKSTDPLTVQEVVENIPENIKKDFTNYTLISQNLNLPLQIEQNPAKDISNLEVKRVEAAAFTEALPEVFNYQREGNVIITATNPNTFVKVGEKPYELVREIGDKNVYVEMPKSKKGFTPLTLYKAKYKETVDLQDLNYLVNKPTEYVTKENIYSKQELDKINQQNFDC